jgi:hypothetical protein
MKNNYGVDPKVTRLFRFACGEVLIGGAHISRQVISEFGIFGFFYTGLL